MLLEQIDQDLTAALKAKNEVVVTSLRNLKAAIKNLELEKNKPLTDEDVSGVMAKKVKQHKDSIESFKAGNRPDLVAIEEAQMQVLVAYLPKQMGEAELTAIVKEVIASLSAQASDFGKVMKEVVGKVKGRADGNMISKIVKENLK